MLIESQLRAIFINFYLVTLPQVKQYRYNYGRKASQTRMKQSTIKLRSKDGKPDIEFMDNYIQSLHYSKALK